MPSLFILSDFKTAACQKRIGSVPNMRVAYTKNFIVVGKLLVFSANIACMKKFIIKQQLSLQHSEEFQTSCDFFSITFCTSTACYLLCKLGMCG